jgi:hypothetical protein
MTEWTVGDLKEWHSSLSDADKGTTTTKHPFCNHETFAKAMLRKTKQISQLIARSWFEDDIATQIRKIFTEFAIAHDDSDLRALFTGRKRELWEPRIFDDDEILMYHFEVSWDTFEGKVSDNHQANPNQKPPYFTVVLPYPPRPALNEFTVTLDQIQEWANSPLEEDEHGLIKNPYPPYPYIPTTSC